jgi:hypothetical protein
MDGDTFGFHHGNLIEIRPSNKIEGRKVFEGALHIHRGKRGGILAAGYRVIKVSSLSLLFVRSGSGEELLT